MTTFIESMENYIRDTLIATTALDDVKAFAVGDFMEGIEVPQEAYPFSTIVVGGDRPDGELTGGITEGRYRGFVTFIDLQTALAQADWADIIQRRVVDLPTRKRILALTKGAVDELRKCEHKDLGELIVGSVVVTRFEIIDVLYGAGRDRRTNNWEGFGQIIFEVETEEQNL